MAGVFLWLSSAAVIAAVECSTTSNDLKPIDCNRLDTPKNTTLNQFMGKWFMKELTYHGTKERRKEMEKIDFCPVIDLRPTKNSGQFVLQWSLSDGSVTYTFQLLEPNEPAVWISVGEQSISGKWDHYDHFAGRVQVLKAGSLLLLSFCAPRQIHYSLTLVRDQEGSQDDLRSAHDLMGKQGLPRSYVNSYCPVTTLGTALSSNFFWPIVIAVVIALVVIFTLFYFCL